MRARRPAAGAALFAARKLSASGLRQEREAQRHARADSADRDGGRRRGGAAAQRADRAGALLEALTAALLVWQAAKEKAKKPFVATERVKRLLAVHVAVNTVLALALLTVSPVLGYLMPAFEPALLMLAALIAAPMEQHIAGQFIKRCAGEAGRAAGLD